MTFRLVYINPIAFHSLETRSIWWSLSMDGVRVWGDFMYHRFVCMSVSVCFIQYVVVNSEIQGKTCGRAGTCPEVHYSRFSRFSMLNFKDESFSWLTGPGVSSNRKRNIQKKKRKYIVAGCCGVWKSMEHMKSNRKSYSWNVFINKNS